MIMNLNSGDSGAIRTMLTEFMSEVNNTLTSFKSEVNTMLTGFTNGIDADMTALSSAVNTSVSTLSTTVNNIPKGAVKSVQRGVHGGSSDTSNITININTVNPAKCLVVLSQHRNSWTYANDYRPHLVSITATSITVSPSGTYSDGTMSASSFSWQVVEFY